MARRTSGGSSGFFESPLNVFLFIVIVILLIVFIYYVYLWWVKQSAVIPTTDSKDGKKKSVVPASITAPTVISVKDKTSEPFQNKKNSWF